MDVSQTIITLTTMFFLSGAAAWGQMGPRRGGQNPGPPAAVPGGRVGNPGGARGPGIYPVPEAPRTYGSPHGYGNVVFPGTGHAPGTYSPFSIVDPSFGTRLSNTVSGFGNPYGYNYGRRPYGGGGNAVLVPYPVYVPYPEQPPVQYAPYAPQTQVVYVVPGEPDRSMTTAPPRESIVTYVVPSRSSSNEPKPAGGKDERKLYLIAFKNYSIYSATDYWVDRDTLHYVTPYGAHNQASLDQIDVEFTERLSRERGMEFRLDKDR